MPEKLIIKEGSSVGGSINVRGSKNAAAPIIASTLLSSEPSILENVPLIEDIKKLLEVIKNMGGEIDFLEERKIRIDPKNIDPNKLDFNLLTKMRISVLLLGPLVARFNEVRIPYPGGCVIGSRPIDTHISALGELGVEVEEFIEESDLLGRQNIYHFKAKNGLKGREIILDEFSVTATENIMMAAVLAEGKTVIKTAAAEPHVRHLALFLKEMGADIEGEGTHTIQINGKKELKGSEYKIPYDYIEAGTFILLGLTTNTTINVKNTPVEDLDLFLSKLKGFGAEIEIKENEVITHPSEKVKMKKIQMMPHPGVPTDLQAPLGVFATQTEGLTLVHDPLYEGRLKYLEELNKMGAEIVICDPHRAIINGPTKLYGAKLNPLDLRGGAALIIAGIIAQGTTVINDATQVDRGYEEIDKRLRGIGVNIERVGV
ncbi:MAG: UDP-N-acetylglucosamine 1-carboxyvinyltransferase [Candidatus Pacebacteria bacterium]|nr:UDP-N-acetylglucosamine 1-carboxyvinyltransferase [Candidatus Paceibacterota bacterium]